MVRAGVPGIVLRLFGTREVGHTHALTDAGAQAPHHRPLQVRQKCCEVRALHLPGQGPIACAVGVAGDGNIHCVAVHRVCCMIDLVGATHADDGGGKSARAEPVQIPAWPSSRTSGFCDVDVGVLDPLVPVLGVPGRLERHAAGVRSANGDSLSGVQSGGPDQANFLEVLPHGERGLGVIFAVEPTSLVSVVGGACDGRFDSVGGLSLALQEFYLWPLGAGCSSTRTEPVQILAWPSSRTSVVCDVDVFYPLVLVLGVPGVSLLE